MNEETVPMIVKGRKRFRIIKPLLNLSELKNLEEKYESGEDIFIRFLGDVMTPTYFREHYVESDYWSSTVDFAIKRFNSIFKSR